MKWPKNAFVKYFLGYFCFVQGFLEHRRCFSLFHIIEYVNINVLKMLLSMKRWFTDTYIEMTI